MVNGKKDSREAVQGICKYFHKSYFSNYQRRKRIMMSTRFKPQASQLFNGIDTYCNKYKSILLMGDFNVDVKEANLHFSAINTN